MEHRNSKTFLDKCRQCPVIGDFIRIAEFLYSGIHVAALSVEKISQAAVTHVPAAVEAGCKRVVGKLRKTCFGFADWMDGRHKKQVFQNELRKVLMLKTPFYRGYIFTFIVCMMIAGLQMISFNTTYSGAEYYMANLKYWAPIVFALVLQGAIVLLSISSFDSVKMERKRMGGLMLAVFVSIAFSYVGIVNSTMDPMTAYEAEQRGYEAAFSEVVLAAMSDKSRSKEPESALAVLNSTIGILDAQTEAISGKVSSIENTAGMQDSTTTSKVESSGRGTEASTVETTTTETVLVFSPEDLERLSNNKSALESALLGMKQEKGKFDDLAAEFNRSLRQGKMTDKLTEMDASYQTYLSNGKSAYKLIFDAEMAVEYESISTGFKKALNYNKLEALQAFPEIEGNTVNQSHEGLQAEEQTVPEVKAAGLKKKLDSLLSHVLTFHGGTTSLYTQSVNSMQRQVSESYKEVCQYLTEGEKEELNLVYQAVMKTKDANFVAFSYLSPQSRRFTSAAVAMLLAVLVDGGTLGLSVIKSRNAASPLYAREREDFYEEEPDLLLSVFLSIQKELQPVDSDKYGDFAEYCAASLNEIVGIIQSYLNKFKVSNATVQEGYGSYALEHELEDDMFVPITSILRTLNYMGTLSVWEYEQIVKEYNGLSVNDNTPPEDLKHRENVYLLRSNAEIYLRQNIAETNLFRTMVERFPGDRPALGR